MPKFGQILQFFFDKYQTKNSLKIVLFLSFFSRGDHIVPSMDEAFPKKNIKDEADAVVSNKNCSPSWGSTRALLALVDLTSLRGPTYKRSRAKSGQVK